MTSTYSDFQGVNQLPAITAGIGIGSSVLSGVLGSNAASNAANAQVTAQNKAIAGTTAAANAGQATEKGVYQTDQSSLQPYQAAGSQAVSQLNGAVLGTNSQLPANQVLANDPGYQFRLDQGQQALDRANAAGGSVGSGGALKDAAAYSQNYASGEYSAANSRLLASNQQRFSQLDSIAGIGSTANSQSITAGTNYANQSASIGTNAASANADALTNIGNAQASGYVGAANAWSGAASGASKSLSNMKWSNPTGN